MKTSKLSILILIIIISLAFISCSNNNSSVDSITVGLMSDTAAIPFIVAQEKGFFEEEGITVDINVFFSAVDRDAALLANELDGVSSDLISAGLLNEANSNIKVISKTESEYKIVSSPNAQIETIQQFNNKAIGLSTNTLMEYLVDMTINKYDLKEVEKVNIPKMPTRLEMLRNDQINGAILPEPLASVAINSKSTSLLSNKDLNLYPGVLLFNKTFLEENEEAMQKFIQAYNKSVDYITTNGTSEFVEKFITHLSFPEDVSLTNVKFNHLSLPSKVDIQSSMQWLFDKEMITKIYDREDLIFNIINQ